MSESGSDAGAGGRALGAEPTIDGAASMVTAKTSDASPESTGMSRNETVVDRIDGVIADPGQIVSRRGNVHLRRIRQTRHGCSVPLDGVCNL